VTSPAFSFKNIQSSSLLPDFGFWALTARLRRGIKTRLCFHRAMIELIKIHARVRTARMLIFVGRRYGRSRARAGSPAITGSHRAAREVLGHQRNSPVG
jgi:hypothetical protein